MAKEKILETAIDLVNQFGTNVSVRQIAKSADVNVAAINYHFGSKDNLINEVIVIKLEKFKFAFATLDDNTVSPIDRLEQFLYMLVDLVKQNPEVADHVINQHDLFKTRYEYQNYLKTVGYDKLINVIVEITNITNEEELTIITEQVLAASIMSLLAEMKISEVNKDFINDIDHKYRVKIFLDNYFYKYVKEGK